MTFVLSIVILCGIGVVFAEYHPVKLVLRMQLFRSTSYLTVFCLLYISAYIASSWTKSGIHKVAIILSFLTLSFSLSYYNLVILVLILYVLAEWLLPNSTQSSPHIGILLFVLFALILRAYSPHNSFPGKLNLDALASFLRKLFEDRLLIILFCLAIILACKKRIPIAGLQKVTTCIVVLVLAFYVTPSSFKRFHPTDRSKASWTDVQ